MLKYQWINTGFRHLFFYPSNNHHLREFNIPKKNTTELGPAWHIEGNHRIRGQKKIACSYSDPGGTLENTLNDLKLLFSRKKSLTFQKRSKKMLLHWRTNLADQNKQQPLKLNIRVTYHTLLLVWNKPLINTYQHCSTSRANQWSACRFLKSRGVSASVFFLPLPLPPFPFLALVHCSRGQSRESSSLSLLRTDSTLATQATQETS